MVKILGIVGSTRIGGNTETLIENGLRDDKNRED